MDVSPSHVSLCVSVDGGWGPWSLWTACGVDCGRQRSRNCTEPEPRHGGRPCDGPGLGAHNCTGGLCIQSECLASSGRCLTLMDSVGERLALWPQITLTLSAMLCFIDTHIKTHINTQTH